MAKYWLDYWEQFSENTLRNAIWHMNNGRRGLPGGYCPSIEEVRQELQRRGLSPHGYHEEKD